MNIKDFTTKFLSRDNEILNAYFNDIKKYQAPTADETEQLFLKYKEGDLKARDEIIVRNQRFICSIAKIYSKTEDEIVDFINEGNIGLITALDSYDPSQGVKFLSYAIWYIRRQMNYYMHNSKNVIRQSNNMKLIGKVDKAKAKYFKEHGYYPSSEEIIEIIKSDYDIDIKDKSDLYSLTVNSINEELSEDYTMEENSTFNEKTSISNEYEEETNNEYYKERLNTILEYVKKDCPKNIEIVKKMYGVGYDRVYSLAELVDEYNMEYNTLMRIKDCTLRYLRQKVSEVA